MGSNNVCNERSPSTLNRIESAFKSGLHFVEGETVKAVSMVESGMETILSPFELCIVYIRRECSLMEKLKLIIEEVCDILPNVGKFIHGEPNICGLISLFLWIGFCYNYQVWMVPLLIPFILIRQFILIHFEFIILEIETPEPERMKEGKSITEMIRELCYVCDTIDSGIEITAGVIKTTKRTLRLEEPEICFLALFVSSVTAAILYYIPLRYFIILASIYSFCNNYLEVNGYFGEKEE